VKRNLFAELKEGFDALKAERQGKLTLRTIEIEKRPAPAVTAKEVLRVRQRPFSLDACAPTCAH
jgi:putative transcriptional regulator